MENFIILKSEIDNYINEVKSPCERQALKMLLIDGESTDYIAKALDIMPHNMKKILTCLKVHFKKLGYC